MQTNSINRIEETLAICATADNPAFETFARTLFANAARQDVEAYSPRELAALAKRVFARARATHPDEALVEVFDPHEETADFPRNDTVLIAINDDQPFLFDSVLNETAAHNARLIAAFHPIIELSRRRVSVIVLILEPQGGTRRKKTLQDAVGTAIRHARAAVRDWQAMRMRMSEAANELRTMQPRASFEETSESIAFLEWLLADNFTFLGYRDYVYSAASGGRFAPMAQNGLGIFAADHTPSEAKSIDAKTVLSRTVAVSVAKATAKSLVHRRVPMDAVSIVFYAADGTPKGVRRFVGLFASGAYSLRPQDIPLMRLKVKSVLNRAGLSPASHDAKALAHIIDTFPRDELFQADEDELFETAIGILHLGERPLVRVFPRFDAFDRYVSAIVFLPRDRYSADVRQNIHALLATRFDGVAASALPTLNDTALARIVFTVLRRPGPRPQVDIPALEGEIRRTMRTWQDGFSEAIQARFGTAREPEEQAAGFPARYRDAFSPHEAVEDLLRLETLIKKPTDVIPHVWRKSDDTPETLRFKLYGFGQTLALSQTLPIFENLGLKAIAENAYPVTLHARTSTRAAFVLDFLMEGKSPLSLSAVKHPLEDAFAATLSGQSENDGFNALVIEAGMSWRDVTVLRAIAKYLRQAAAPFSQSYMERTLVRNPEIARLLFDLFRARFTPPTAHKTQETPDQAALIEAIEAKLGAVPSLDDDRILRRFRNAILSMVRTNFYQCTDDFTPRPALAFKFDSHKLDGLPAPRPMVEIFVYSPDVEGIHLRFGPVARGGLRWSDRAEDFRTEVLGLVKAQQVKNTVIVPVGAKGGFFPKRLGACTTREETQAAGIAAYRIFVGALLDLTDNLTGEGTIVPPPDVVRHDGDDPYLVVAADKGTATFSDIANAIALDRGFWLGDAFASGGSHGYDHKAMAITARGAWEAVKRHFRELGRDIQSEPFTCIGVGDMSGDVFGNGMLLSKATKLVAAFDHRHIFIDPNPDPTISWNERKRLFDLPRSSWADYDTNKISQGGGVFVRTAKTIPVSAEMRALCRVEGESAVPADIIKALLQAKVDLLFFGGIGTFVKASQQTHDHAGDRTNDAVRIDAADIGAKVVGEGANLGLTQAARIEAAQKGVRLNTDAIDNSAGVDTSDHEVNLKILLGGQLRRGEMTGETRDRLLADMTDDVAALVLKDNIDQTLALSVAEKRAVTDLEAAARFMRDLEIRGRLNRAVEGLPGDTEIAARLARGTGLTRPELAVLLAYAKLDLKHALIAGTLIDDPLLTAELAAYFPAKAAMELAAELPRHRLRREIVTDRIVNRIVNLTGPLFVFRLMEVSGVSAQRAVRAIVTAQRAFGLDTLKTCIDGLTSPATAAGQIAMVEAIGRAMHRLCLWFVVNVPEGAALGDTVALYREGVEALRGTFSGLVSQIEASDTEARIAAYCAAGAPADVAEAVGVLPLMAAAPEIILMARLLSLDITQAAGAYFAIGEATGLDRLRLAAQRFRSTDHWEKLAIRRLSDDLFARQRALATAALTAHPTGHDRQDGVAAVEKWVTTHADAVGRVRGFLEAFAQSGGLTVAKLTLAVSRIGELG